MHPTWRVRYRQRVGPALVHVAAALALLALAVFAGPVLAFDDTLPRPPIRSGDRGDEVARLQALLTEVGYDPGPADGVFGRRTEQAIRALQRANGLPVTGLYGSQTRRKLAEALARLRTVRYTVRRGDTLATIAARFGTDARSLSRANGLKNMDQIQVGQVITIPAELRGQQPGAALDPSPSDRQAPDAPSAPPGASAAKGGASASNATTGATAGSNPSRSAPTVGGPLVDLAGSVTLFTASHGGSASESTPPANEGHPGVAGETDTNAGSRPTARRYRLALTFDDGPDPERTPQILRALEKAGAKATFFVVGNRAEAAHFLVRAMAEAGHQVESHTYGHADLTRRSARAVEEDLRRAALVIESITGRRPRYFRPPLGRLDATAALAAARVGQTPLLWTSVGIGDEEAQADDIVRRALGASYDGAILLLHETSSETVTALPRLLAALVERGFALVTVDELLAARTPARPRR